MTCVAIVHRYSVVLLQGGSRRATYEQGAPAVDIVPPQVDEAALAELSEADRAAVLAAMAGAQPEPVADAVAENQDLPKFDCRGSMEQLQARIWSPRFTINEAALSKQTWHVTVVKLLSILTFVAFGEACECVCRWTWQWQRRMPRC